MAYMIFKYGKRFRFAPLFKNMVNDSALLHRLINTGVSREMIFQK